MDLFWVFRVREVRVRSWRNGFGERVGEFFSIVKVFLGFSWYNIVLKWKEGCFFLLVVCGILKERIIKMKVFLGLVRLIVI